MDKCSKSSEEALSKFSVAFALMSIIPILLCIYLFTVKFFSISILAGTSGLFVLLAVVLALLGLLLGHEILYEVLQDLIRSNAQVERLSRDLEKAHAQLDRLMRVRPYDTPDSQNPQKT